MSLRVVVFDAVGTLIHPTRQVAQTYHEIGQRHGSQRTAEQLKSRFHAAFERQESIDRERLWQTDEAREWSRWRDIVADSLDDTASPDDCFRELFEHFARPDAWRLDSDTAPSFQRLRNHGIRLAMASNFDRRLHGIVAAFPELQALEAVIVSSEAGWRKPSARFFSTVCSQLHVSPHEVLHVGDVWENDVEGARAVGCRAVLFDPRRKSPEVADRVESLLQIPVE